MVAENEQNCIGYKNRIPSYNKPRYLFLGAIETTYDAKTSGAAKPFWQKIQEIGAKVPREEWEKLPKDFARNFESYMYGVPTEE